MTYLENLKKLTQIKNLPEDWNGYKANKFDEKTIKNTENLLKELAVQPELFPTAEGTIQLEYENGSDDDYLEFTVNNTDHVQVYMIYDDPQGITRGQEAFTVYNLTSINQINTLINAFMMKGDAHV